MPISFLIFTYAVLYGRVGLEGFLLMFASLTCFISFYLFYQRIQRLNISSYDHIFALELHLGISAHLTLKVFYEKNPLLQKTKYVFKVALLILAGLWTLYLTASAYSQIPSFMISIHSLLGGSVLVSLCLVPVTIVTVLYLVLHLPHEEMLALQATSVKPPTKEERLGASLRRVIIAIITFTVVGTYSTTVFSLALWRLFWPSGDLMENLVAMSISLIAGLGSFIVVRKHAHQKYKRTEVTTAKEVTDNEKAPEKLEAVATDGNRSSTQTAGS